MFLFLLLMCIRINPLLDNSCGPNSGQFPYPLRIRLSPMYTILQTPDSFSIYPFPNMVLPLESSVRTGAGAAREFGFETATISAGEMYTLQMTTFVITIQHSYFLNVSPKSLLPRLDHLYPDFYIGFI